MQRKTLAMIIAALVSTPAFADGWTDIFKLSGSAEAKTSFGYQPGSRSTAQAVVLEKDGTGRACYERTEPSLAERVQGFMLEGFISGSPDTYDRLTFGAGLEVSDRISLVVGGSAALQAAARTHEQLVCEETLATSYVVGEPDGETVDLGAGERATISVTRA